MLDAVNDWPAVQAWLSAAARSCSACTCVQVTVDGCACIYGRCECKHSRLQQFVSRLPTRTQLRLRLSRREAISSDPVYVPTRSVSVVHPHGYRLARGEAVRWSHGCGGNLHNDDAMH